MVFILFTWLSFSLASDACEILDDVCLLQLKGRGGPGRPDEGDPWGGFVEKQSSVAAEEDSKPCDFESGSMESGGLTFTQDAGGTLGEQPVKYQDAHDSRNSAGGTYLFRSDYGGSVKVRDGKTGVFRSTTFTLGPGEITFDYSGSGGYVAGLRIANVRYI